MTTKVERQVVDYYFYCCCEIQERSSSSIKLVFVGVGDDIDTAVTTNEIEGTDGDDESKLVCRRKLPSNSGTPQSNPKWISCMGDGPKKQVY